MAAPENGCDQDLMAMFAAEARIHLSCLETDFAALAQGANAETLGAILESLHTLAGAARAVELLDLEYLCRALERVFEACRAAGAAPMERDPVARALAIAPELFGRPAGRIRNQALAICSQLDALATQTAQPGLIR